MKQRHLPLRICSACLLLLAPAAAFAQAGARAEARNSDSDRQSDPSTSELEKPEPTQGFYVALGLAGVAATAYDDDRGTRRPSAGWGFNLRLGEAVTSWLDLGIASEYATTLGNQGDALRYGGLRVQAQVYPWQRWFVRGGFGVLGASGADPEDRSRSRGAAGSVFELGLGTNLFLSDANESGGWVVTPVFGVELGPDPRFTTLTASLGLEFSWWSGLSRDKLDLPIEKAY